MNGVFNMNFMMTFLLAKDLPETRDKVLMAMTAGQSPNLLTPVLLKAGPIDTITGLTQENTNLKTEISALEKAKVDLAACQAKLAECQRALDACEAENNDLQTRLDACLGQQNE